MPQVIETIVYQFKELTDEAKEKAREWYREGCFDYEWWDCVEDDAKQIAGILGIDMENMYFSGFSSQGDGACFTGHYSYSKGCSKKIRQYAPKDTELHRIADELTAIQKINGWMLSANIKHSGHYYHSKCMDIDVDCPGCDAMTSDADERIIQAMRDFADWIYSTLEKEYEYLLSDSCVDESIEANEYTFEEDGTRA